MQRFASLLTALVLLASVARAESPDLTPPASDAEADVWAAFSNNLVVALQSGNHGLACSALQHVVTYRSRVDVRAARFEVVRLYRDHVDLRVRLLALAALTEMRDPWVVDFLQRSAHVEQDPHLARLTHHAAVEAERVR